MPAQQPSTSEADSRQKATLFCPHCGHESDVTGDWTVQTEHGRQIFDCPVCYTTITERLLEAPLTASSD
ncbi:CPXCG motif-containing cysteine-rich protein [Halorarius litoreus]|uniref:CPXCG motif-containing cysteine-rich protein n=1 Tax=Halorarius litoreus TaxID=2962676 RepID=UPI0020CE99ED|nr:CPXCG motif-containing cysteine-rich protein [Halorarius litoreus]